MDTEPLKHLPELVRSALIKAGWKPGVSRCRSSPTVDVAQSAERILTELHGLEALPVEGASPWRKFRVRFETDIAQGYEEEIRELERRLHVHLAPVANVGNGVAIMLIADTGHVLLLGYAGKGVLLAGATFGEAMHKTLTGEGFRTVCFTDDAEGQFLYEGFDRSDPTNYWPGPRGLRELSGAL